MGNPYKLMQKRSIPLFYLLAVVLLCSKALQYDYDVVAVGNGVN